MAGFGDERRLGAERAGENHRDKQDWLACSRQVEGAYGLWEALRRGRKGLAMTSYAPAARDEQRPRGLSLRKRRVALWSFLWVAGCLGTIGVLWPVVADGGSPTVSDLVYRLTGGSFVAAGLVAWQRRPAERVGALMVATGFLFFVAPLAVQVDSSIVQTVGLLGTDYWTIAFVVLLLVFPQSRVIHGRLEGALVVAFAIPLVVAQPLWLLFLDDPDVVNDLGFFPNDRAADWIDKGQRGLLLAATLSLFLFLVWRWWHASPPLRRVLLPVLAGGATMLSFGALLALDLINGTRSQTQLTVTLVVLATVPVAFVVGLLRSRLARVAIGDLVLTLRSEAAPAELRAAIARSLHDPSATLAYWLPEYGTYGDLDGRLVSLPDGDGQQATTLIDREGRHVAALVHDRSLLDEPELLAAVTAAAGIAHRERAAPRRPARAPGGGSWLACARDRGRPEGAQAPRARPARRRPAAAGGAGAQPETARA